MEKVLITGGTGLVGTHLTDKLIEKGYDVAILSRNPKKPNEYKWDITANFIDEKALLNVDYIIHLAGAGIADKRWTEDRKKVLINSRVKSADLLFNKVKALHINLKGFISASGIGYYGALNSDVVFTENHKPAHDFIAKICIEWETAVQQFETLKVPVTILRTGVVLSKQGGALQKMNTPLFLSVLGSGKQCMPWIHIDDVSELFLKAISDEDFKGVFNAVAPAKETNQSFTKTLGKFLKKWVLTIAVPGFMLKLILGELSVILLKGALISSEKIAKHYQFKYADLTKALQEIYHS